MLMKIILFCMVASLLVCNSKSAFILVNNNAEYTTAISKPTPTIVALMTTTCGYCKMMKPIFENLSTQYTNMQFVEQFLDSFYPNSNLVPGLYNGTAFGLPVMMVYKNGQKIDGSTAVRTQVALEAMIVKNGGIKNPSG